MRVLCLVFAALLLVSLAAPGSGQYGYHKGGCTGRCKHMCLKYEVESRTPDCKKKCCTISKKG